MSSDYSNSYSNNSLINSIPISYESDYIALENKIVDEQQCLEILDVATDEKQLINVALSNQDIRVNNSSKKTFTRKRSDLAKIENDVDLTNRNKVEAKTNKKLLETIRNDKRRRHYSEGSLSLPKKSDENIILDRRSQRLQPSSTKYDLNSNVTKINSSSPNINLEPSTKNTKSGSALPSLKLSIQSLDTLSFKKGALTKRKMHVSTSEKTVSKSPKDDIKIARKYIESFGKVIKEVKEKEAVVFDRDSDRFVIKRIHYTEPDELVKCVRKILLKIKAIADYEIVDVGFEDNVNSFEAIIAYLEQSKWSSPLLDKNSQYHLDCDLDLTKKAIEDVKKQNNMLNELSIGLVGLLFDLKLEVAETKMTLNDLSLVFPKIKTLKMPSSESTTEQLLPLSLPELLSKVLQALTHLKLRIEPVSDRKDPVGAIQSQLETAIQRLLEFCVKCFENKAGLNNYPNEHAAILLAQICLFATDEMKIKLNNAFARASIHAEEVATAKSKLLEAQKGQINHTAEINEPSQVIRLIGFHQFFKDELKKDLHAKQEIISQIAKSIVKKTASEFIAIPLDELLSGKDIDSKEHCPFYSHMSTSINSLSYIVAGDILSHKDMLDRRKVIAFYADVIKECVALGDFASAYSLQMGFGLSFVSRLHHTWDEDTIGKIKFLNDLFNDEKYYESLHIAMNKCQNDYFIIPPKLFGSKLNFIENTLSDEIIKQSQLRRLAREVIMPFQTIQKNILNLSEGKILVTNEIIDKKLEILKLSVLSEDTLRSMSRALEVTK
ncbi:MAG TPA: RasGEF domain-containing protein [Parachlamydiaceae bacterium]|nr:RasGEF domain-containing protein [Parachlamydiaceae bacterium]